MTFTKVNPEMFKMLSLRPDEHAQTTQTKK
jgi:hypothetical protein